MREFDYERYDKVKKLKEMGLTDSEIGKEIKVHKATVKTILESGERNERFRPKNEGMNVPQLSMNTRKALTCMVGIDWPTTTYVEAKKAIINAINQKEIVREKYRYYGHISCEQLSAYLNRELVWQRTDGYGSKYILRFKDDYESEKEMTHEHQQTYKGYDLFKIYEHGQYKYYFIRKSNGERVVTDYIYEAKYLIDEESKLSKKETKRKNQKKITVYVLFEETPQSEYTEPKYWESAKPHREIVNIYKNETDAKIELRGKEQARDVSILEAEAEGVDEAEWRDYVIEEWEIM